MDIFLMRLVVKMNGLRRNEDAIRNRSSYHNYNAIIGTINSKTIMELFAKNIFKKTNGSVISNNNMGLFFQAKPAINQPDDAYENEADADAIAESITHNTADNF